MIWLVIYCDGNNLFVEDLRVTKDHATFRDANGTLVMVELSLVDAIIKHKGDL